MMTDEQRQEVARIQTEALMLAGTLHTIILESEDPEVIRVALSGLQGTEVGRNYLAANPIHR